MMQIRKIKPEDIDFVIDITSKYRMPDSKYLSKVEHFLICEYDNIKCGCGCLIPHEGKGYINCVIVDEEHRRKKLGDAIVRALLNIADLQGIQYVYASGICEDFLQAMGFEKYSSTDVADDIKKVIGDSGNLDYFRVSLKGYFKPCSH
ncbi:MAG: GNAT family N-acetyltransferase [Clostridiaceae bacterium]|nr:GNAT family N-acetyltransferase [Clostridiaceae bacterium]